MLRCGIFRQLFVVMSVINMANTCGGLPFSSSWRSAFPSGTGAFPDTRMATVVQHRNVNLVSLAPHEPIASHCGPGDIAIVTAADGWWLHFIGRDGAVNGYDRPYPSYNAALWAAKAAAEYGFD